MSNNFTKTDWSLLSAWLIALIGIAGSLYFSDTRGLTPCLLCWYQRIALYPLGLILPIGLWRRDRTVAYYAIPLLAIGAMIALYQNLLVWQIIPSSNWCSSLSSCADGITNWFGFISLPLMSLVAFILMLCLLIPLIIRPQTTK